MASSNRNTKYLTSLAMAILFSFVQNQSNAQVPEYDMFDGTVYDCDGILYDSGGPDDTYASNENTVFTITSEGTIVLSFNSYFEIEQCCDIIYIYDGPDTGSPLIATLNIDGVIPPDIVATSGSLTIQLISDNSAQQDGFVAEWNTIAPPPPVPAISVNPLPQCNSQSVQINFSYPLGCDWVDDAIFTFTGADVFGIGGVQTNCVSDSSLSATLQLNEPIDYNCEYTVVMDIMIPDVCDSLWEYIVSTSFIYGGCPILSELIVQQDTVCTGQCTTIEAQVEGCFDYTYSWNNGLPPSPGPHSICPATTTTYSVTITEIQTGNTTTETQLVVVSTAAILDDDMSICQSQDEIDLQSTIAGEWSGPGIIDTDNGIFEPDSANAGPNVIVFNAGGCTDNITITVEPIYADSAVAACPGSAPFQLNAIPSTGIWDGPFTTVSGIFDPTTAGNYQISYELNGCFDTTIVNVGNINSTLSLDTICQSVWADTLDFTPFGGIWSGSGIVHPLYGIFDPAQAAPGDITLTYMINGCSETFDVHVLEIYIDGYHTACPFEPPLVWNDPPTPAGGWWEGDGIIDTVTGYYDPSLFANDTYTNIVYHAPNGCTDTTFIYNVTTFIVPDTFFFCTNDDAYWLVPDETGFGPGANGDWTGAGLTEVWDDAWVFDPAVAGAGGHLLFYNKNNCIDSLMMMVFPNQLQNTAYELCETEPAFTVEPGAMPGGSWSGTGITDSVDGIFDPSVSGDGNFEAVWTNPAGCSDTIFISVEEFLQAEISGLNTVYCFNDTVISFDAEPPGGVLSGASTDFSFNPAESGGAAQIVYSYQGTYCSSSDTLNIIVYPEIETSISVSDTVLCLGESTTISVSALGGNPNLQLAYEWSNGGFPVSSNTFAPQETTTISVTTSDGCSDPITDLITIEILPPIVISTTTSDTLCFGEQGFASVTAISSGDYIFSWDGVVADEVTGTAGSVYELLTTDVINGCEFDTLITIPGYPPITANFSINPNEDCVAFEQASDITFIDLCQNAVAGEWDFGSAGSAAYVEGENPQISLSDAGAFTVTLSVVNIGGCPDSHAEELCILPPTPIFIPDIFSPNNDGHNDMLFVRSQGIISMTFLIYDRWGEKVFESGSVDHGWDGRHNGKPAPSDSYSYYIKANLNDGTFQEIKGQVALVR